MQSWRKSAYDSGGQGQAERNDQSGWADADHRFGGNKIGRQKTDYNLQRSESAAAPRGTSRGRQHKAFAQKLAHHASAACADSGADGDLAFAGDGTREQQVGYIAA